MACDARVAEKGILIAAEGEDGPFIRSVLNTLERTRRWKSVTVKPPATDVGDLTNAPKAVALTRLVGHPRAAQALEDLLVFP